MKLKLTLLLIISLLTLNFPPSAKALTYQEILQGRDNPSSASPVFSAGQVLGASTTGLVGYWNFDEQSGTILNDSSGSGNNGILTNGPTWISGKVGSGGLSFDGVDDVITTTSDFIGTGADSFSAWIYPRSAGEGNCGTVVHNFSTELQINCGVGNVLLFTSNNYTNIASSAAIFPSRFNTWIHVVVTRTSSGTANIYVDGVLSGTANQNSGTPAGGSTNVNIGNRTASLDQTFDGIIDEVRVYNRALTAQEVLDIYNDTGGTPPPLTPLLRLSLLLILPL